MRGAQALRRSREEELDRGVSPPPPPTLDPRIKLRHLTAFIETDRQGGVLPAAEALGLTQPAISKSLAELEDILDVALFDRTRRKLALTEFGALFLRYATATLSALRQ